MVAVATSVDSGAAVYATLPATLGLQVGMVVQDPNGYHWRMLVKNNSGGTIAAANGFALVFSGNVNLYQVVASSAANQLVVGCNDLSGQTIPIAGFFWMTIKGPANFLCLNATAAGAIVNSSATTGQLATGVTAGAQTNITNTVLVGGSPALSPCWMG